MNRILLTCAGLALLFSLDLEAQTTTRVLIVGDSWAEEQWDDGSHALVFAENDLHEFGIYGNSTTESGSTAFDWKQGSYLQLIDAALDTYPDIDTVQLTVGGNDFLDVWHTGMTEAEIETLTNAILFDLGLIIDYILNHRPDIEVLLSLYDYPNFRDTLGGLGGWFACGPRHEQMGEPTPLQLNTVAVDLVEAIADIATANHRIHYVDHFGLMQNHYGWPDDGIPPGSIEPPGDINEPSPYIAMREHLWGLAIDCFHLKAEGYDVIVQNLVDQFLSARMHGQAEVELDNLAHTYDGATVAADSLTVPPGLLHSVTYDGQSQPPVDAGTYTVVATIEQLGWEGQVTDTLVIDPASANLALSDLEQTYNGQPHPVTVETDPPGLAFEVTYDGVPEVPVDAGSYAVVASVADGNYIGDATTTLHITPAMQAITFNLPATLPDGHAAIALSAEASSGLDVEFSLVSGPASIDNGELILDGDPGTVIVQASQPGNHNWLAAEAVSRSVEILADELFRDEFQTLD